MNIPELPFAKDIEMEYDQLSFKVKRLQVLHACAKELERLSREEFDTAQAKHDASKSHADKPELSVGDFLKRVRGTCEADGCDESATTVAQRHNEPIGCFCEKHAEEFVKRDEPEYVTCCPNCNCLFGVG